MMMMWWLQCSNKLREIIRSEKIISCGENYGQMTKMWWLTQHDMNLKEILKLSITLKATWVLQVQEYMKAIIYEFMAKLSPRLLQKKVHSIIDLEISIFYLYLLIVFIPNRLFNIFTWFSTADIYMNIKSELIFYPWHSICTHIVFFLWTLSFDF